MIILASKSCARQQLLTNAGVTFQTQSARIDERKIQASCETAGQNQSQLSIALAASKALDVSKNHPQAYVIGADQTLQIGQTYLHKPADVGALKDQLDSLKGRTHTLCSAATIVKNGETLWSCAKLAHLTMRNFFKAERDQMIDLEGEELLNCVGGYRFEGPSINLFEKIDGDYFTVLGLPLIELLGALRNMKEI